MSQERKTEFKIAGRYVYIDGGTNEYVWRSASGVAEFRSRNMPHLRAKVEEATGTGPKQRPVTARVL